MDKKALIPLPYGDKNKFSEDTKTLTTSTFFRLKPVYVKEVVPGENVNINISSLTRLGSLQKPMYGDVKLQLRSFFVPMRLVFPSWNDFIVNTDGNNSPYTHVPTFSHTELMKALLGQSTFDTSTRIDITNPELPNDFVFVEKMQWSGGIHYDFSGYYPFRDSSSGTAQDGNGHLGFVFTPMGRRFYDILLGLGYNFNFGISPSYVQYMQDSTVLNEVYSAMPLLCYAKLFCDWFTNSQYGSTINTLQATINTIHTRGYMIASDFVTLANLITYVTYDRDLFVSAFDEPTSPNDSHGTLDEIQFVDLSNNSSNSQYKAEVVQTSVTGDGSYPSNETPYIRSVSSNHQVFNLTEYALNALRSLTNYVRRNQIAGVRALDRYYSRFGVQLSSEKLLRSQQLASWDIPFDVAEVMSTADTLSGVQGLNLGDYAGKGIGGANGLNLQYNSDGEFGFLIITSDILPFVRYYQGLQPHCSHIYVSEFWQPEFDGLGVDVVPQKQLYNDCQHAYSTGINPDDNPQDKVDNFHPNGQFGFLPRYYDKKSQPYAILSGSFHLCSRNTGLDAWHLLRKIDSEYMESTKWQHSENFTNATADGEQYNRIFQDTDADLDGFISVFNFNVTSYKPIMRMFDNWVLEEDDSEHHDKASISVGGTSIR